LSVSERHPRNKPPWLKVRFPSHRNFFLVSRLVSKGACTRNCAFCAVNQGIPAPVPEEEALRVAETAAVLKLRYVVITSVTRDDLPDGGAAHFTRVMEAVRNKLPEAKIEILTPDFQGDEEALRKVIAARPDVFAHNLETPEELYPAINRKPETYQRSLHVLEKARELGALTKSGLMLGLGESRVHILQTFSDLRRVGCDLLTIGQYLQPRKNKLPVRKYYSPCGGRIRPPGQEFLQGP